MTKDELVKLVIAALDDNCMDLPLHEYAEAMEELAGEFKQRSEMAEEDLNAMEPD